MDQDIPVDIAEREYRQISYYQWVPFFMLLQAFLYYIPCLMWRLMSDKSGISLPPFTLPSLLHRLLHFQGYV